MKNKTLKRLLNLIKPYTPLIIITILCAVITVVSTLYSTIIIGKSIDKMLKANNVNFEAIKKYLIELIVLSTSNVIFLYIMYFINNTIIYKLIGQLRKETFLKLHKVPISYLDRHPSGDIISRIITDIDAITDGLIQAFTELFTGVLTILFTLGFMFYLSWQLALVVLVLTPLSLITASFIAKKSYKVFKAQATLKGELSALANEMLDNQRVLITYNYNDNAIERYNEINQKLHKVGIKAQLLSGLVNPSTRLCNALVYAAVGVFGAYLCVKNPAFGVGSTLYVFLSYASSYTKPFNTISNVVSELQNSLASGRRVFEFLDEDTIKERENASNEFHAEGNLSINNVSFRYVENKPLIENFNLNVKTGQTIAIVGPTGCGKTTFINLIMRFYDINSGDIKLDNTSIYDMTRTALRDNIGMVLQDTWLFRGSIYENIAYGKMDATREEVIEASKKAFADDFIRKMPNGYDTIVNDDDGLSIGQKQLLCIARLMLKLPKILILDEATSNIDTRTEILVQDAFKNLMKGRTSFVIAHRLQTIKNADIILVMKNGNVIESGNHETLLAQKGFYYTLYNSQFE